MHFPGAKEEEVPLVCTAASSCPHYPVLSSATSATPCMVSRAPYKSQNQYPCLLLRPDQRLEFGNVAAHGVYAYVYALRWLLLAPLWLRRAASPPGVCLIAVKRDCGALVSGFGESIGIVRGDMRRGRVCWLCCKMAVSLALSGRKVGACQTRQCERAVPIRSHGRAGRCRSAAQRIASAGPGSGSTHHRCL